MKKQSRSYLVNTAIACGVLYYALDLSRGERTAVDWVVITLVAGAILWNLVRLGQRLYRTERGRGVWHLQRTLAFWIVGGLNTILLRPEEVGSWKHWMGWTLIVLAAVDTAVLFRRERRAVAGA